MILNSWKKKVKLIIESLLDVKIYSNHAHGREDWFDLKQTGLGIDVIFDVGANIGQSAQKFREAFPQSIIYCFEPVNSIFNQLKNNLDKYHNVSCYQIGLGSSICQLPIYLTDHSNTSSFKRPKFITGEEVAHVDTIDNFSLENNVDHIDLLKIDAEGFDLEVLKGACRCLSSKSISFILIEVGFNPEDEIHVLFDDVRSFLWDKGYTVFGIYDQTMEWSGKHQLRYANVCFCKKNTFY